MMLLVLLFFMSKIAKIESAKIYNCLNGTVYLNINELAFFETTNFPQLLSEDEMELCYLKFVLKNQEQNLTNIMLHIVYLQFNSDGSHSYPTAFKTINKSSYLIKDGFETSPYWHRHLAQQGHVIFVDETNDNNKICPLESISRKTPFQLTNEKQLIFLRSNFDETYKQASCKWQFSAPHEYGFKIFIQWIQPGAFIRIKNSTDLILNEKSITMKHPYYNEDNIIVIDYIIEKKSEMLFFNDITFQAYITIVKKAYKVVEDKNCRNFIENGTLIWTNINKTNYTGYKNNAYCHFNFTIPKSTILQIFGSYSLEIFVEQINFYINSSKNSLRTDIYALGPYKNETNILWEFISDGSFPNVGFEITFTFEKCQCDNLTVSCQYNYFDEIPLRTFCGDFECNITIESCSTNITKFSIDRRQLQRPQDIFRVISNGDVVLELNPDITEENTFYVFLNSSNENIFSTKTFSSPGMSQMRLNAVPYNVKLVDQRIMLNENLTSVIINTAQTQFVVIEMPNSLTVTSSFLLYCLDSYEVALYNNESLTTIISDTKCFEDYWKKCEIKSNTFALYSDKPTFNIFFVVRLSDNIISNGCVLKENIFTIFKNSTITALATQYGKCLLTLLIDGNFNYQISHIWTSNGKENIKIFVGLDQTHLFLEFNSKTAKKWSNIYLFSKVYTILIPETAALVIRLENSIPDSVNIAKFPYQSVLATPSYGYPKDSIIDFGEFIKFEIEEYPVMFTVLKKDYLPYDICYFEIENDNKRYIVNKIGDEFIFQNQSITIFFDVSDYRGKRGVVFFVQTLK